MSFSSVFCTYRLEAVVGPQLRHVLYLRIATHCVETQSQSFGRLHCLNPALHPVAFFALSVSALHVRKANAYNAVVVPATKGGASGAGVHSCLRVLDAMGGMCCCTFNDLQSRIGIEGPIRSYSGESIEC